MDKITGKLLITGTGLVVAYGVMSAVAKDKAEDDSINDNNPYFHSDMVGANKDKVCHGARKVTLYESEIKPALDKVLSFGSLVILWPLLAGISFAVWIDDPGPVFFTQKRIGKDKRYVMIHKFRTMRFNAPHDVPTHQLTNADQYITKVGRILRKTSLDELPQLWDIFCGKMSIIGPRPALWNQDDLVLEREKYGANSVMPGLTGWAQINGRDELEIPDKARLDGEYAKKQGLMMDIFCFFGTIGSVLHCDGVVEGGTGKRNKTLHCGVSVADPEAVLGCDKKIKVDKNAEKKILITGAGSYIGGCIKEYLAGEPEKYKVDIINTVGWKPAVEDFKGYNAVINVSGIAHVRETDRNRYLYDKVNRDLAIAIAKASKEAKTGQFIQLSTMAVYGMVTGEIKKKTVPYPNTAYGESKLAADEAIKTLGDERFKVSILRPPMVYGKNCKGNYQLLRSFALQSLVFPQYKNQRSMIFVGNLCEFVKWIIDNQADGLFFPQNKEYVNTSNMVRLVAEANGKRIRPVHIFNGAIKKFDISFLKKAFGDLIYEKVDLVEKYDFEESIKLTEQ